MEHQRFSVMLDAAEVVERLKTAAAAVPMGLVAHINGQANCAARGLTVAADQILEIFRPDFAVKVWAADKRAGLDIPIRIHVYAHEGATWVSCRLPSAVFRPYADERLDALGRELDDIFLRILSTLDSERIQS